MAQPTLRCLLPPRALSSAGLVGEDDRIVSDCWEYLGQAGLVGEDHRIGLAWSTMDKLL